MVGESDPEEAPLLRDPHDRVCDRREVSAAPDVVGQPASNSPRLMSSRKLFHVECAKVSNGLCGSFESFIQTPRLSTAIATQFALCSLRLLFFQDRKSWILTGTMD